MRIDEIETRLAAIKEELKSPEADLDKLSVEVDALIEERKALKKAEEQRRAMADKISGGEGRVLEKSGKEPDKKELRNSEKYIEAFAKYIKTGSDKECRSILSLNADSGTVPVPDFLDGVIRTAWDNEPLMQHVHQTNLAGNVRIGFELSTTDAAYHAEGADAPAEEDVKLGIVTMVPKTIKKWVTVSDEALELNGVNFLNYIYSEIAYKIANFCAKEVLATVLAAPQTATSTAPAVAQITATGTPADLINAVAQLSDEAQSPIAVMSKAKAAAYKVAALSANYAYDPFDGLTVVENNSVGDTIIVGDFQTGFQANFPNGNGVQFKYDDLSLAEKDLVKIVGREPVAMAVVANNRFCKVVASA